VFVERKTHREGWKGEESVKERFMLQEKYVIPWLEGRYTVDQARKSRSTSLACCCLCKQRCAMSCAS
jgi:SPX domain protein involved in polyphosphate accumulation